MKKIFARILLILLAVSALAFGISHQAAAQVKDVRIADGKGDWGYPNPYRHYPRGPGYIRMSWAFDTLVWKDQNGYIPALAQKWSYDKDNMAFTFELNPKAKWHDGKPLTAQDVVFSFDYYHKHPYRWVSLDSVARAEATGPHTVVVKLTKPYAPFISDVAGGMPILPQHIWQSVKDPKKYNDPKAFIGSGPYLFRDFNRAKRTYLYEAFDGYYQGRPKADRLIYVRSGKGMVALLSGQVDLANIQPEMAEPLKKKGMKVISGQRGWNKKLMINHRKPPFNNKTFRHALAYAINQQELINKAHRGLGTPASYGLLSIDHEMYNPNTPTYPYNQAKARQLLESLGYKKGPDGFYQKNGKPLALELLSSNVTVAGESVADRDGEIIKKQLQDVGIKVSLLNLEQATTDSRVKNWKFDLAVSGHGGLMGDPRVLADMIMLKYGAGSVNSAKYGSSKELNRLLDAQMEEMDPAKRKQMVYKIQEIYAKELPAISLYYPISLAAYNPKKGIKWYYTKGGIGKGIPIPQNKMSLIK